MCPPCCFITHTPQNTSAFNLSSPPHTHTTTKQAAPPPALPLPTRPHTHTRHHHHAAPPRKHGLDVRGGGVPSKGRGRPPAPHRAGRSAPPQRRRCRLHRGPGAALLFGQRQRQAPQVQGGQRVQRASGGGIGPAGRGGVRGARPARAGPLLQGPLGEGQGERREGRPHSSDPLGPLYTHTRMVPPTAHTHAFGLQVLVQVPRGLSITIDYSNGLTMPDAPWPRCVPRVRVFCRPARCASWPGAWSGRHPHTSPHFTTALPQLPDIHPDPHTLGICCSALGPPAPHACCSPPQQAARGCRGPGAAAVGLAAGRSGRNAAAPGSESGCGGGGRRDTRVPIAQHAAAVHVCKCVASDATKARSEFKPCRPTL